MGTPARLALAGVLLSTSCRQVLDIQDPEPLSPERISCADGELSGTLWTLSLRVKKSIVLKNTSSCARDFTGATLLTDDPTMDDCEVSLDAVGTLEPGQTVRVHETKELTGDVDALAAKLGPCADGQALNPQRRGAVYLCRGGCTRGAVDDMVAYLGYSSRPEDPELQDLGATFEPPLVDIGLQGDRDDFRYQRIATAGRAPDFSNSDWVLVRRTVFADFEVGVDADVARSESGAEVTIRPEPFEQVSGDTADKMVLFEPSPSLGGSLALAQSGASDQVTTLRLALPEGTSPTGLDYFIRTSSASASGGHVELRNQGEAIVRLGLDAGTLGADLASGERAATEYAVDTWHHVELRGISWESATYDLFVDGVLVRAGAGFLAPASAADELWLDGAMAGVTVGFDAIELWQ